jgi:hypothetical protein
MTKEENRDEMKGFVANKPPKKQAVAAKHGEVMQFEGIQMEVPIAPRHQYERSYGLMPVEKRG